MKVKKQFWLEKDQAKYVEKEAKQLKISESEIVRQAIDNEIAKQIAELAKTHKHV